MKLLKYYSPWHYGRSEIPRIVIYERQLSAAVFEAKPWLYDCLPLHLVGIIQQLFDQFDLPSYPVEVEISNSPAAGICLPSRSCHLKEQIFRFGWNFFKLLFAYQQKVELLTANPSKVVPVPNCQLILVLPRSDILHLNEVSSPVAH